MYEATVFGNFQGLVQYNLEAGPPYVADACAWVYEHVASYGGDPRNVSLVGQSAGAHLSAVREEVDRAVGTDVTVDTTPDVVGAYVIHGLMVCNTPESLALSMALNATLIMPRLVCTCDRYWGFLKNCRFPFVPNMPLPFNCPQDALYDPTRWNKKGVPRKWRLGSAPV